jgi:hypothetical protein
LRSEEPQKRFVLPDAMAGIPTSVSIMLAAILVLNLVLNVSVKPQTLHRKIVTGAAVSLGISQGVLLMNNDIEGGIDFGRAKNIILRGNMISLPQPR